MKKIPEAKVVAVKEIKEKISKAKGIALVDYKGLTVAQDTELRNEMRKNKVEYKVVKNKFMMRAFNELGIKDFDKVLEGPSAIAISYEDAIAPAKIAAKVGGTTNGKLSLKAGYAEGKAYNQAEIVALSKLPAKEVLVAQLLGMLTMPIRNLAVALNQIAEKQN